MLDAVLISYKGRTQEVKQAVAVPPTEAFFKDHHPWGWFERPVIGDRFQVKRIVVHPGAALSPQSHHHWSEHWIVVHCTAKVTVDADVKLVSEN
jgi:mannose-1-phosphate guanylyltransferase/mannose-6-phosphate isomerase